MTWTSDLATGGGSKAVDDAHGLGDASPLASAVYSLGRDTSERQRLERQAMELHGHAADLLDRTGIGAGQSAIDVGCGPRGIIDLLSARVGPGGRAVGLDLDPVSVELARAYARDSGLRNVTIVEGDARRSGLHASSFDVVHTRTLLVTVPDPISVITEMVRLTKPGGWVAAMEPDMSIYRFYPSRPVWDRIHEVFVEAFRVDGADPFIGRRLPELLRAGGLTEVGVEARADVFPAGHSRRTVLVDLLRTMRTKIVARGIATESELDGLDQAAREHLEDPGTLALPNLFVLAWGRKRQATARVI